MKWRKKSKTRLYKAIFRNLFCNAFFQKSRLFGDPTLIASPINSIPDGFTKRMLTWNSIVLDHRVIIFSQQLINSISATFMNIDTKIIVIFQNFSNSYNVFKNLEGSKNMNRYVIFILFSIIQTSYLRNFLIILHFYISYDLNE